MAEILKKNFKLGIGGLSVKNWVFWTFSQKKVIKSF